MRYGTISTARRKRWMASLEALAVVAKDSLTVAQLLFWTPAVPASSAEPTLFVSARSAQSASYEPARCDTAAAAANSCLMPPSHLPPPYPRSLEPANAADEFAIALGVPSGHVLADLLTPGTAAMTPALGGGGVLTRPAACMAGSAHQLKKFELQLSACMMAPPPPSVAFSVVTAAPLFADRRLFVGHPLLIKPHARQGRPHESMLDVNVVLVLRDTASRPARTAYHQVGGGGLGRSGFPGWRACMPACPPFPVRRVACLPACAHMPANLACPPLAMGLSSLPRPPGCMPVCLPRVHVLR